MNISIFDAIIESWLDNDAYNFHQASFFFRRHRKALGKYAYKLRSKGVDITVLRDLILQQISHLCKLRITKEEAELLRTRTKCHPDFCEAIIGTPILEQHQVDVSIKGGQLVIRYWGPIWKRILVETPLLATISELHFKNKMTVEEYEDAHLKGASWIAATADWVSHAAPKGFGFTEGGTRRRFSKRHYENVLVELKNRAPDVLAGTSNVFFGIKYGIPIVGTMAHQLQMYYQAITSLMDSIPASLKDWHEETNGELGTGLSDTLGDKVWAKIFNDPELQKAFHTERQDSGDPYLWAEKRLRYYKQVNVSTDKRSLLFSDSLDIQKALDLFNAFSSHIGVKIMIGTFLTNSIPVEGHQALSQVIKLVWTSPTGEENDYRPLVKLSADLEKSQGECDEFTAYAIWTAESCEDIVNVSPHY